MNILEIKDRSGRKITLNSERWSHILEHPEMSNQLENIRDTIEKPQFIKKSETDDSIRFYFKQFKDSPTGGKYLLAVVKFLNSKGYIITAFYADKIAGKNE